MQLGETILSGRKGLSLASPRFVAEVSEEKARLYLFTESWVNKQNHSSHGRNCQRADFFVCSWTAACFILLCWALRPWEPSARRAAGFRLNEANQDTALALQVPVSCLHSASIAAAPPQRRIQWQVILRMKACCQKSGRLHSWIGQRT